MQTTTTNTIQGRAIESRPYQERLVAKGFSISQRDAQWIRGLAQVLGCSESQVLRGVLAEAREIEQREKEAKN